MKEEKTLSSSEQYVKKSNRRLLFIGLGLLVLFLIALLLLSEKPQQGAPVSQVIPGMGEYAGGITGDGGRVAFSRGSADLAAQPSQVSLDNVVLGSQVEAIVILTAKEAPIRLLSAQFAETQQDGFVFEGTCAADTVIPMNQSCTVKILWNPVALRQIQNTLVVRWREDNPAVFRDSTLNVLVKAQSTDSADCVICEDVRAQAEKKRQVAMGLDGNLYEVGDDGTVIINGKKYTVTENGLIVDENGNIVGIVEPQKIPVGLNNQILGSISDRQDVIAADGQKLGRLLGDDTIVDASLTVLGAALPVVSVMDDAGQVIGKLMPDGTVVGGADAVIGRPIVDGSVADLEGKTVGTLRPWGLVINFMGDIIGGIMPDGTVKNATGQTVAFVKPTGLAVNAQGELLGGVIPRGTAVGTACKSLGTLLLNGRVKDGFDQEVGKVLLDGAIVDDQSNEKGTVVSQGLVINEKGDILGFVNSEGKAVDTKGSVIGCINPDGTVSAGKRIVGAVMEKGRVIGQGCQVMGSVYPDGNVLNTAAEVVGRVLSDRYVKNANNRIVGVVVPRGTAVAEGCRLLGLITLNGHVLDLAGNNIGCVTPELTVVNAQMEIIGGVAPKGLVVDPTGKIIGRVRLDGKVIDKSGNVIGCVNPDGTVTGLDGKTIIGRIVSSNTGVILDENGNPTGWTVVGTDVYDENGNLIGKVQPNGWITDLNGNIIGIIVPDGVVFSHDGRILGRYSKKTGVAVDAKGERFARILPDFSAVSGDKTAVIGALIPDKTTFMDLNNGYVGMVSIEGILQGTAGETIGAIRADGSVVDKAGVIIGTKIPQGKVLSLLGKDIGSVSEAGAVLSPAGTAVGKITAWGIAVSDDDKILGGVFPEISVPIGAEGVLGALTYQGAVQDNKGRRIGTATPFGNILADDGRVLGRLVRIGPFADDAGKLVGWVAFSGELNNVGGDAAGALTLAGTALDKEGRRLGSLIPRGAAVDTQGALLGYVSPDGQVGKGTQILGTAETTLFVSDAKDAVIGRIITPGAAIAPTGELLGWTRHDGAIVKGNQVLGTVGMDERVFQANGTIRGAYVPFSAVALDAGGRSLGVLNEDGKVVNTKGQLRGSVISPDFVAQDGQIVGRLLKNAEFATDIVSGKLLGQVGANGVVYANDNKVLGYAALNAQVENLTKRVVGAAAPVGVPLAPQLTPLGKPLTTGQVSSAGKIAAAALGNTVVYSNQGSLIGGVFAPGTFIDRVGAVFARSTGNAQLVSQTGAPVASVMTFHAALTTETVWAGGALPSGTAVNDDAETIGVVSADGTILGKGNALAARVLSDGVAVKVSDKSIFATMPYAGGIARQGLPFGYKGSVLGRTTIGGDIVNADDQKTRRILDDGTILGTDMPLDGAVLSFNTAIGHSGIVLGTLSGDGAVLTYAGEENGKIAVNGAVKGNHRLLILGALVPSPLVSNDCKTVGQTAHAGQVINGRGSVVGRILPDKWAVDAREQKIGRVVRFGPVMSPTGNYLGRTMPDSTVVDTQGISLGCARNDGTVVDHNGNIIGGVIERGLVIDENGNVIGRVKANGDVVNAKGEVIGKVRADGKVIDKDGNIIGRNVPPDEEIFFNEDGTVSGTFSRGGEFRNPEGELIFTVDKDGVVRDKDGNILFTIDPDGTVRDARGNRIPGMDGNDVTFLVDNNGNVFGIVSGCDVLNLQGEKIASILPDGSVRTPKGDLFATILGDGTILAPDGSQMGTVQGTNKSLDKCGIKSISGGAGGAGAAGAAGRRIFIGNQMFDITPNGSLINADGTIVGYIGEDGRPYSLDNRLLTGVDEQGRRRPQLDQKSHITPEQVAQMQQLLALRRQNMKKGIAGMPRIRPDERLLVKSKKKQDEDWGLPRIVSSWPVDMSRVILKDKAIPAVLVRSIDSRYPDVPVTAIVERHIYAEQGRNILIPAGSRLIGTADDEGGTNKVAKLEITWTRLIRPDGVAFKFDAVSGDAQGRGGVAAYLDEQLLTKYGKPVLTSVVTSAVAYMIATNDDVSTTEGGTKTTSSRSEAADDSRENFINAMGEIFDQLVEEAANVPPVVFVPSGTRLTVFSNEDLWLRMESDDEKEYEQNFGADTKQMLGVSASPWTDGYKDPLTGPEETAPAASDASAAAPETKAESAAPASAPAAPAAPAPAASGEIYSGAPKKPADDLQDRVAQPIVPRPTPTSGRLF